MITDILLSIVLCVRNRGDEVSSRLPAITQFMSENFRNYEIIVVDDGSADQTSMIIKNFSRQQKNIRLLRLSRHYGAGIAVAAGLQHAIGDYAAVMELNDPIESILQLLAHCKGGYDAVFAMAPASRGILKPLGKWLARLSGLPINPAATNFVVMRRKAMNALLTLKDRMHHIAALAAYMGMNIDYLGITTPRRIGHSEQRRNFLHMLESVLAYSRWPLWLFGASVMGLSALAFLVALVSWILSGFSDFQAFITTMVTGLLMLTNGILFIVATTVGRILAETKRQPLYYVAEEISSRTVEIASIVRAA